MAKLIRTGFLVVGALAVACGGSESSDPEMPNNNTVTNPQVELSSLSIDLSTVDLTLVLGSRADLKVEGAYSDGTTRDLTADATWTSSNEAVARFIAPGRLVTMGQGAAEIRVAYEGQSASEQVVISAPVVTELALEPPLAIKGIGAGGGGIAIKAIATYSDDSVRDVTKEITEARGWSSSNPGVGFMNNTDIGRLSLFTLGEVTITAQYEGVTATGRYLATMPVVESISIDPKQFRVQVGNDPQAVTVSGLKSDGMTEDLTNDVTWTVDDPTIASFSNGVVQAVSPGNTYLRASYTVTVGGVTIELTADAAVRVVDAVMGCGYPVNFNDTLTYDDVLAPHIWADALNEAGELVDLSLEEMHCDESVSTIAFVIGAGWCPYCPAFKEVVDNASTQLEQLGMKVVYVEIETNTGAAATHSQANDIVNRTMRVGESTRVGAFTSEQVRPFARVPSLPNLVVVRTSDMKVIRRGRRDDLATMAANPAQLYGDAW